MMPRFIWFIKGATSWELQIYRLHLWLPYWRFLKCGCKPGARWVSKEDYEA